MEGEIVCRQGIVRPCVRICAVEPQRVAIVAIDIDCSGPTRGKVTVGVCVVADERDNNTGIADLLLNIAKVGRVGELDTRDCLGVFVLGLDENDRSAVSDLCFGDDLIYAPCVAEQVSAEAMLIHKLCCALNPPVEAIGRLSQTGGSGVSQVLTCW